MFSTRNTPHIFFEPSRDQQMKLSDSDRLSQLTNEDLALRSDHVNRDPTSSILNAKTRVDTLWQGQVNPEASRRHDRIHVSIIQVAILTERILRSGEQGQIQNDAVTEQCVACFR